MASANSDDGLGDITSRHERFKIRNLSQLRDEIARLDITIPVQDDVSVLGESYDLSCGRLPNRFVVHPMEGFDSDADGRPGPLSFRRYRRYAEGGSGLIWFEATAVMPEGRSNPGQLCLRDNTAGEFARLVSETRQAARDAMGQEMFLVLQLTHSGRYSKPTGLPTPMIAHHSPILDPIHGLDESCPLVTDEYLDALQEEFVQAAMLAQQAGFDAVDVKSCHRYLVSELLASHTRPGKYGGSFENRTRFLRETLGRIRDCVPGLQVTTRLNAYDAISYPYGWGVDEEDYRTPDLSDPLRLIGLLQEIGIPLLNLSIGNPYFNPHYGRPYDFPIQGANTPREHPLFGIARFIGITREVQETYPSLPVIGSGYTWLRQFMPHVAAAVIQSGGAALVGQGRGAFAYPDSVRDTIEKGAMDPAKCCVTCSGCTQIMRDGGKTGCVVRDKELYGPLYRQARRFAVDRLQEEARRCRECEEATCTRGCPARIDIPAFLSAFADGDIATAYSILRDRNVLPEMCGFVCPAAEQCEGHCLEDIFCKNPLPIQDIQLVVARHARLRGLVGVSVPTAQSGNRVAVVGGGPAGLAATIKLIEKGHRVTILEKGTKLGGVPDTIIPGQRYIDGDAEVDAILAPAREAGRIEVQFGTPLGSELTLDAVARAFDAVFLATGLGGSSSLGDGDGVVDALTFLRLAKLGRITDVPTKVAVLGGGNTAMDAGVTAIELGARDVYMVYRRSFAEMPAWSKERNAFVDAGGHVLVLTQPLGYETDDAGHVTGVRVARTELGATDAGGRRTPIAISGSESVLPVGLVIEALGQHIAEPLKDALSSLHFGRNGLVKTGTESQRTNVDGVFAGGDLVNGGTTAVQGIVEGMRAAEEIHSFLDRRSRPSQVLEDTL